MSLKESITAQDVCGLLNELLEQDEDCITRLVTHREQCNELIAAHETVQCSLDDNGKFIVGIIGILNGFFGIREDGMGGLCYEEEGGKIIRFKPTPEEKK